LHDEIGATFQTLKRRLGGQGEYFHLHQVGTARKSNAANQAARLFRKRPANQPEPCETHLSRGDLSVRGFVHEKIGFERQTYRREIQQKIPEEANLRSTESNEIH